MPKEGHISLEDLDIKFGYSMTAGSTHLFTAEENEYREELREFLWGKLAPLIDQFYKSPNPSVLWDIARKLPGKFHRKFFPIEAGGEGKGLIYHMILNEEVSALSYSLTLMMGGDTFAFWLPFLSQEQLKEYVMPCVDGEKLVTIAITEPTSGSDALGGLRTTAKLDGDEYVINGEKRYIANGSIADFIMVYAITNPNVHPRNGISAFIVPGDTDGFETVKNFGQMGRDGTILSHIRFNNCRIPKKNLVGEENKGSDILTHGLVVQRVRFAVHNLGAARTAFEIAAKYAAERMQFDRAIRQFEGISFKIADMYTRIEASRLLCLNAMRMAEAGLDALKEAGAAKLFSTETAFQVASDAMQVLGGIGYTKDYPIERILRDVRCGMIADGSSEVQRFVIQRQIFKELGY